VSGSRTATEPPLELLPLLLLVLVLLEDVLLFFDEPHPAATRANAAAISAAISTGFLLLKMILLL
jgi:hypothetical protein